MLFSKSTKFKDKDVLLKAIIKNGMVLKHTSNKHKNDKDVVLKAVKQNGWALQFASKVDG